MARHRIFCCNRSSPRDERRGSSCICNERQWGLLNGGMIQALARMVNQSADRVGQFLYQLSLQLFARILYPLMAGWNTRKIPFSLPDTCELYYNIFDEYHNIRCPIPTRTLLILISMMQYFLNLPRQCCRRKCGKCTSSSDDTLKNIHNPGYCQNVVPFRSCRSAPKSEPSPGKDIWRGLKRLGYQESSADLRSIPSDESITYGYAPHRCPCQGSEAPRKPLANPYANLSGPLALESACEKELQSPLLASDCKPRISLRGMSPEEIQCYYIANISSLYSAVVEDRHSRQLLGESKMPIQRIRPCEEKLRSAGGMMIPQPYSCSWLQRNPQQIVKVPSRKTITSYRGESMGKEVQGLVSNYDMVRPLRENRFLPARNQALEPYRSPYFTNDNYPRAPRNFAQNIAYERNTSVPYNIPLKDQSLVKVNQVKPFEEPLDYLKEMREREQLRSISRPIKEEKNFSISQNDINPNQLERSKILNKAKSLDSVKPNRISKIMIVETHMSSPNIKELIELQNQKFKINSDQSKHLIDTKFKPLRTKSLDRFQNLLGGIVGNTTKITSYSFSEKSVKENSKDHSGIKNQLRKVAGESLFFITPSKVKISQPEVVKPKAPPKDNFTVKKPLLNQKTIESLKCLDNRVHFRVPILKERKKSTEKTIINYKPKTESKDHIELPKPSTNQTESLNKSLPKLKTRSLSGNDKERMNRKVHFQRNILQTRSISRDKPRTSSPDPELRFPNLFLALSRRIQEGSQ